MHVPQQVAVWRAVYIDHSSTAKEILEVQQLRLQMSDMFTVFALYLFLPHEPAAASSNIYCI